MVVDAAFLTGTIASFLMNGACCMYQVNREDELRDELRQEIRREWYQQRKRDIRKQRSTAEERRREFEEHHQTLMARRESQSYTHTHNFFSRTSPDSPSVTAQMLMSRSSSILDDCDEEEDDDTLKTTDGMLLVTGAGSDGTMDDVSINS